MKFAWKMRHQGLLGGLTAVGLALAAPAGAQAVDPGLMKFWQTCGACHTFDRSGAHSKAPNLWGLFGKTAGMMEKFGTYSPAMKAGAAQNIVWTEETLDRWLQSPQAMIPGNEMEFQMDNAADRTAVIAYIRTGR